MVWIIRAFLFALSGVCLLLVCLGAKIYPITKAAHSAILDATESLAAGGEATDPLTGKAVVRSAASHAQLRREAHPPSRRDMGSASRRPLGGNLRAISATQARALLCARALAQQPLAEDAAVGAAAALAPHGAAVNSASSQHARCGQAAAALARRLHRHPGRHGGVGRRGAPVHRRHRRHLPAAPSLHSLRRAASLHTSVCEAGAICCSALFVLVPWDAARLQVLLKMSRAERAVGPSAEEKDNSARS